MRSPILRAARAAGAAVAVLLAACSTCKDGESRSEYPRTLKSDWKLIERKTHRYRDCSEFMKMTETTELGSDTSYYLAGPAGETRIDRYFADNLAQAERIFNIHDTVYLLREKRLEIFLPESLKRVPLFPVDYEVNPVALPFRFHKWGDAGIGWNRSYFSSTEDYPLAEFLTAETGGHRWHSQRDSVLYFDAQGRHYADIDSFFRFEYHVVHDHWFMQGRYYGIFQNDEKGFVVVSRDEAGRLDTLRIVFPPASGYVPNIHHVGYGLIALYSRKSRAETRIKRFGFLDYVTRSVTWKEAYWAHFEHGKPVYRTTCDSYCD